MHTYATYLYNFSLFLCLGPISKMKQENSGPHSKSDCLGTKLNHRHYYYYNQKSEKIKGRMISKLFFASSSSFPVPDNVFG